MEISIGDHPEDTAEWKGPIVGNEGAACVFELGASDVGIMQVDAARRWDAGVVLSCVELVSHGDAWNRDSVASSEIVGALSK